VGGACGDGALLSRFQERFARGLRLLENIAYVAQRKIAVVHRDGRAPRRTSRHTNINLVGEVTAKLCILAIGALHPDSALSSDTQRPDFLQKTYFVESPSFGMRLPGLPRGQQAVTDRNYGDTPEFSFFGRSPMSKIRYWRARHRNSSS
jgi:hypothetical protein